jgi:hypothetical protein
MERKKPAGIASNPANFMIVPCASPDEVPILDSAFPQRLESS